MARFLKSGKRVVKALIPRSFLLSKFFISAVKKNCFHGEFADKNTLTARTVRSVFWSNYYKMPIGLRSVFQEALMGGAIGVDWAKEYHAHVDNFPGDCSCRIGSLALFEAWPHLALLNDKLKVEAETVTVIQLGASSGREIAWLARENPNHKFIYTDIFDDVVNYAAESLKMENMSFCTVSADNLHVLVQYANTNKVVILSSGSAQYVHPEHLDLMFKRIFLSLGSKEAEIFIGEPAFRTCNPLQLEGSFPRGNFSYSHNYQYYAEKNGWNTVLWQEISPYTMQAELSHICHLIGVFSAYK